MKIIFTLLVAAILIPHSAVASGWNKQSDLNFPVSAASLENGDVAYSFSFSSPDRVAEQWSHEVDIMDAAKMPSVHVLTMKTAFIVSKSIKDLKGMDAKQTIIHLAPDVKVESETPAGCINASTPLPAIPLPLLPKDLTFTIAMDKNTHPVTSLDKNLGAPDLSMTQAAFNFNMMIKSSSNVMHFYPIDATHTLVVAFETYTVKDESIAKVKYIPFFNLQNKLVDKIKSETQGLISRMDG